MLLSHNCKMTLSRLLAHWLTASALLCASSYAQGPRDGALGEVVDETSSFSEDPIKLLSLPLWRVDHFGVGTPSVAKRFFKTDVLGVFGAAYLTQCMPLLPSYRDGYTNTL